MSTSKLSKIETGKLAPSAIDVQRVLTALGVSEEVMAEYMDVARVASTEATAWRLVRRTGVHKAQHQVKALESQMSLLRVFQPALVPGLLQTPEYIRAILTRHGLSQSDLMRTVSARLDRQQVLYESGKELQFVITESALRWRITSPARLAEQIDRIISLSRIPTTAIGIIPLSARQRDIANHAFVIRDDRLVTVETVHAEIVVTDPRDVALYVQRFDGFASVALFGDDMRSMLADFRDQFLHGQETD